MTSRPVLRGPLVSESFVRSELQQRRPSPAEHAARARARRALQHWWRRESARHGPASSPRALHETALASLLRILGYAALTEHDVVVAGRVESVARCGAGQAVGVLTAAWNADLDHAWRAAATLGTRTRAPWCLVFNGTRLRLVEAARPFARRFVECDLEVGAHDADAFDVVWALARARALWRAGRAAPLDELVAASARHQQMLCAALDEGVRDAHQRLQTAFARATRAPAAGVPAVGEQALTVVFRLLFLLYAEARGATPLDHPIYRESYSMEALRLAAADEEAPRGLWAAMRAAMRLAHDGCAVRGLDVTAFNGRLFSPAHAPLAERARVGDEVAAAVVRALGTREDARAGRRVGVPYAELGVEQLGAVYERLMDAAAGGAGPASGPHPRGAAQRRRDSARKASGTFYTPRALTEFLVRRTLGPLVEGRDPDAILRLRVLDPAMGSGAFLVAACRYLASAYERALVEARRHRASDFTPADRAGFRRLVAQRCLYGVDANPMAVQLARLSLWLTTLAADRPLTFLDHRLRVGDSLVGASPADLARQPPGPGTRRRRPDALPLLAALDMAPPLREAVARRLSMSLAPERDAEAVRRKEQDLAALERGDAPLARWRRASDLWCAAWFWPQGRAPGANVVGALVAEALGSRPALPAAERARLQTEVGRIAGRHRFLHWTLDFPEVFADEEGNARVDAGFDAVLGNPPWDVLRAEDGTGRADVERYTAFVRGAGLYVSGGDAHVNRYQLFVERALDLVRHGGRVGLVTPWGLLHDAGAAAVRRRLLDRVGLDAMVVFDNRRAIFPIHRSVRFVVLTGTSGAATATLSVRPAETSAEALDDIADRGAPARHFPVAMTRDALTSLAPDDLAFPAVRTTTDLDRLLALQAAHPRLADPSGWGARFGRELNATDDRAQFTATGPGAPVLEGKHVEPFSVDTARATWRLPPDRPAAVRLAASFRRPRVAFRDVASPGNRLTLIAAVLPAGTASTHTLSCLRTPLTADLQDALCALLNSFVANWFVRHWVGTHVTTSLVHRLPMPAPDRRSPLLRHLVGLGRRCAIEGVGGEAYVDLQAWCARAYGLRRTDLAAVLETFPLVEADVRGGVLQAFARLP